MVASSPQPGPTALVAHVPAVVTELGHTALFLVRTKAGEAYVP